ncbi:hypothetical protein AJ88_23710 [Mesorhizobium amorphae CCBAU 01583]|nr:hypothetical protein AJ88_23710 [Mesorhizobium amorphae CCBAU 01583]
MPSGSVDAVGKRLALLDRQRFSFAVPVHPMPGVPEMVIAVEPHLFRMERGSRRARHGHSAFDVVGIDMRHDEQIDFAADNPTR